MFVQVGKESFVLYSSIIRFNISQEVLFITVNTGEVYEIRDNYREVFNNLFEYSTSLLLDGSIRYASK